MVKIQHTTINGVECVCVGGVYAVCGNQYAGTDTERKLYWLAMRHGVGSVYAMINHVWYCYTRNKRYQLAPPIDVHRAAIEQYNG